MILILTPVSLQILQIHPLHPLRTAQLLQSNPLVFQQIPIHHPSKTLNTDLSQTINQCMLHISAFSLPIYSRPSRQSYTLSLPFRVTPCIHPYNNESIMFLSYILFVYSRIVIMTRSCYFAFV